MERTFEAVLVEQCAPTLAGLKPASLFRYQPTDEETFRQNVADWSKELVSFGMMLRVLKVCPQTGVCLLYLYRDGWLRQILTKSSHREFLQKMGYTVTENCAEMLEQLSRHLCLEREFPHEIGVFLGYPLEDVVGFIENHGRNYTYCGCWKAYGDPVEAKKRFEAYRHCTAIYRERFRQGIQITKLIAA